MKRFTCEELEHEDSEGPVIGADVVTAIQNHLRSHVLGSAAEGPRLASLLEANNAN